MRAVAQQQETFVRFPLSVERQMPKVAARVQETLFNGLDEEMQIEVMRLARTWQNSGMSDCAAFLAGCIEGIPEQGRC